MGLVAECRESDIMRLAVDDVNAKFGCLHRGVHGCPVVTNMLVGGRRLMRDKIAA